MHLATTIRRDSSLIVMGVLAWGASCSYLVKTNYHTILQDYKMPMGEPPTSLYDIIWITVYITTLLSIQLVWHTKLDKEEKKTFSLMLLASAVLNVTMYVLYYVYNAFLFDNIIVTLNTVTVIAMIIFLWSKSKVASLLLLPYLVALIFSIVTLNLFILAN